MLVALCYILCPVIAVNGLEVRMGNLRLFQAEMEATVFNMAIERLRHEQILSDSIVLK